MRIGTAWRVSLLLLLATRGSAAQAALMPTDRFADSLFAARFSANEPGAAIAMFRDGRITHLGAYGVAELAKRRAITSTTNFYLASVAKPFTALLVHRLVRDGRLRYDDRLAELLPELTNADRSITVRHLLTHSSGLADFYGFIDWPSFRFLDNRAVLDTTRAHPASKFAPGTKYEYSNTGYVLLALIAERRGGAPFAELLSRHVLRPAGMRAVVYDDSTRAIPDRAVAYSRNGGRFLRSDLDRLELPDGRTLRFTFLQTGQGGLFASIADLAEWGMRMLDGTLVSAAERDSLFAPMLPAPGQQGIADVLGVGHGWFTSRRGGRTIVWHDGTRGGSRAIVVLVPAERFGIVVLANRGDADLLELATLLMDGTASR